MRRWPLVGRQTEFDTIRTAITGGSGMCGVVVTGDAGVGKTTLAREVTSTLEGVRWFAGTESARSVPLGAFAHLVGNTSARDPVTFISAARAALVADGPPVIGVDDAHLLDQLSATLLHQLVLDRAAHVVATVRSGESVPDAVVSMWKDGYLTRLDLLPFTKEQCVALVESVLGGHLEGLTADLIWEASGGNALYLHHLVDGALDAGTLRNHDGVWQLRGRVGVTKELAALLDGRLDRLPDAVLHALQLLTLCEPLDLDLLEDLAGADAVEHAEQAGLVRVVENDPAGADLSVRFHHPLFGEAVRRRVGRAAARRLRGDLVAALRERAVTTAADRIRLAELAVDSDRTADPVLLTAAANDAIGLADLSLSERFARSALAAGGGVPAADILVRALVWQGEVDEVERTLSAFDPAELNQIQVVRWGTSRAAHLLWSVGDADGADEVIAMLRERITEPALMQLVDGIASACEMHENRLADAIASAHRVLSAPRALPVAIEWACFGGARALALSGRGGGVAVVVAKMHAVAAKCDGLLRFPAALGEIQALAYTGEIEAARRRAQEYFVFSSTGQYLAWALANTLVGTVEVASGRFDVAVPVLEQALAAFPEKAAATWSLPAKILLVQAYSAIGRVDDADAVLSEARGRLGRHVAVFGPGMDLAGAWVAAARGTTRQAIDDALAAAEAAAASGQLAVEAEALHSACRFGARDVAERLADLAGRVDGVLVQAQAAHAAAAAAGDGVALDAAAAEFERIGVLLSAADAAAQAATAYERADDRRATVESAATANRLAAFCGGARTPALRTNAAPLPLTPREREIANLVAAGLSNRQIADRLVVSVRTVEGHLYRMCVKLDISDREELATLIRGE